MDADSSVTIYKARIVAKGFRQVQGVDYDEIFSLVAMLKSVRIMLAIAAFYEIWQMDVKTTFLNGFQSLHPFAKFHNHKMRQLLI